jgi:AAA domain
VSTVEAPQFQISFKPAHRSQVKARIGIFGPSASGKTLMGLRISIALQNMLDPTKGIAAIDSEHERINLYAEEEEFLDTNGQTRVRSYPMKAPYSPDHYIASIAIAEGLGAQVLFIDSISHEWFGKGGVQQIVDEAAARQTGGNKWAGWSVGTPAHNSFVEAIMGTSMHVVCTMRAKTEWIQVGGQPKKVGLGPVQREGMEYEFDAVIRLELDHTGVVEVSRAMRHFPPGTPLTADDKGYGFTEKVWNWISEGAPREVAQKTEDAKQVEEQQQAVAAQEAAEQPQEAPAEAQAQETPEPQPEAAEAAQTDGKITPAKKGAITKAINALQEEHGDYEGGTDWSARLKANLPKQKWNTRSVASVDELTDEEGDKLLATIANTSEAVAAEKAKAAAEAEAEPTTL